MKMAKIDSASPWSDGGGSCRKQRAPRIGHIQRHKAVEMDSSPGTAPTSFESEISPISDLQTTTGADSSKDTTEENKEQSKSIETSRTETNFPAAIPTNYYMFNKNSNNTNPFIESNNKNSRNYMDISHNQFRNDQIQTTKSTMDQNLELLKKFPEDSTHNTQNFSTDCNSSNISKKFIDMPETIFNNLSSSNNHKIEDLCCPPIDGSTNAKSTNNIQQQYNETKNIKKSFIKNSDTSSDISCTKCRCTKTNTCKTNNCRNIINDEGINLPFPPTQLNPFNQNPILNNTILISPNALNTNNPMLTFTNTNTTPSLQSLNQNYAADDIRMKLPLIIVRPINNNKNCLSQSSSTTTMTSSSTASFESVESTTTSSVVSSPSTNQKSFTLLDPSSSSPPQPLPPQSQPLNKPNSNLNFKRKNISFKTHSLELPSNIHLEEDGGDDADDDDDDDIRQQRLPINRPSSSGSVTTANNQQNNCLRREVLQRNSEEALMTEFNQTEMSSALSTNSSLSLSPLTISASGDELIETKLTTSANLNACKDGAAGITIPTSSALNPFLRGIMPKTQSVDSRPIYPNVPYSPYGSPYNSPRSNRRKTPLRESRRISIEKSGSFLQLNQYKLLDQIGQGSYGLVKLAYNEEDSTHYAMKILSKRRLLRKAGLMGRGPKKTTSSPLDRVYREIAVLKKLDHPNVVKLIEVLDDPLEDSLYLVFELVEKGEVISIPSDKPLSEERACSVFRDAIQGLEYLHYQRIIHADIKPGNLLIGECGSVKIADLGVCNEFMGEDATMNNGSTAGTPAFRAPETLIPGQHLYSGKASDIWALGATLYSLIYGNVPFVANNVPGLYEKIKNQTLEFLEQPEISDNLKDLLEKILTKDPAKRITLPKLKEHPWVTTNGKYPLPSEEENCRLVQISDEDINTVVKSIPKLDTLILIKTMLKHHSFQNPFTRGGITRRAPRFTRAGRSISAPGAYHLPPDRQLSSDNILPALTENVVTSSGNEGNESSTEKSP